VIEHAMKKGELSRQKLVDATATLLQRQGFHATGLSQIVSESGAPRGSLYFYFPGGKEELACAALEAAGARYRELLGAVASAYADPGEAVEGVCQALGDALEASAYEQGCPLATVALEASSSSDAVRSTVAHHYETWIHLISARLVDAGLAEDTAPRLATFALAAIEGALLLSKVEKSQRPLREVGTMLRALVTAQLRPRPPW
jgi:TetR/AcrR family transcriptional repressor of lmrAB and yxaGH operons